MAIVCAIAGFTTLIDSAVMNIGLPSLRASLHADGPQVQWILASYSLGFGLALVPAGRLGDSFGRRRLFLSGIGVFAAMGITGALAVNAWMVVGVRLSQGIAAGVVSAQVLALITGGSTGPQRARALGAYSTAGGLAGLVGPIAGGAVLGLCTADVGWRIVLLFNVPFALVTLLLAMRFLPADHRSSRTRPQIDGLGLLLVAASTGMVMLPVVVDVPSAVLALCLIVAALAVVQFVAWERRFAAAGGTPILLPALLRSPGYLLGTSMAMFWFGAVLSVNLVLTLFLIEGLGYSPLSAALVLTGGSAAMALASAYGWRMVARFGRKAVVAAVVVELLVVVGYIVAGQANAPVYVFALLAVLSGASGGLVDAPNRVLTLEDSPEGGHGVAAAFLQLSQRLSATISTAAVSGLYLSVLAGSATAYGDALGRGMLVCAGMLVAALLLAVADARRRAHLSHIPGA